MIDVHQNLGFVETFFCRGSRVIDNRCKYYSHLIGKSRFKAFIEITVHEKKPSHFTRKN